MTAPARAVVIGGGPAGLRAAYDLTRAGVSVTVLEGAPVVGGLASSFNLDGVPLERYYHFICRGDDDLVTTLADLALDHLLCWRPSRMAQFVDGRLYPFVSPLDLLRFRPLTLAARLRAGLALVRAKTLHEEDLAPLYATEWLRDLFGEPAYRAIWEPLMRFKFAEYAPRVSAAWIWARMVRLSRSRPSAWREELGYIAGGSRVVLEGLARAVEMTGGRVLLGARAEAILLEQGRAVGVRTADGLLPADVVVSTVTTSTLRRLLPPLDHEYFRRIDRIPTIGIVCALLRLKHPVTPVFWVNANDRRVPFAGMIEYTHLNPLPDLGGDRILYIPQYLAVSDARFAQDDETVISGYADALALIQPAFERSWIRQAFVFRERFAQPVCLTDYRSTTPAIATPITNLFLTDSCQLHPHDRSISGALGLGRNAARLALDALRTSTRS